jgi:hypothetical protein
MSNSEQKEDKSMGFMKRINYEMVCIIASAVVVIFTSFPANVISGERFMGGCKKCSDAMNMYCGTSEYGFKKGTSCEFSRFSCYGYSDEFSCYPISASLCSMALRCIAGSNEICY